MVTLITEQFALTDAHMNGVGVIRPDDDGADEKNGRQANESHAASAHNSFGHYAPKSFKLNDQITEIYIIFLNSKPEAAAKT